MILESPALPVTEGDAVTLRCRSKATSSTHIADFYKDDVPVGSGSIGEMTIRAVSESDEGLYKCSISDFGESPQSWLSVRGETAPTCENTRGLSCLSCHSEEKLSNLRKKTTANNRLCKSVTDVNKMTRAFIEFL